jgi:uncharacterized protein YjdB
LYSQCNQQTNVQTHHNQNQSKIQKIGNIAQPKIRQKNHRVHQKINIQANEVSHEKISSDKILNFLNSQVKFPKGRNFAYAPFFFSLHQKCPYKGKDQFGQQSHSQLQKGTSIVIPKTTTIPRKSDDTLRKAIQKFFRNFQKIRQNFD